MGWGGGGGCLGILDYSKLKVLSPGQITRGGAGGGIRDYSKLKVLSPGQISMG